MDEQAVNYYLARMNFRSLSLSPVLSPQLRQFCFEQYEKISDEALDYECRKIGITWTEKEVKV